MLVTRQQIIEIASSAKKSGKKIVFTNGCFDLIHPGHTEYLARAKSEGDLLVVGLNSDDSVKRIKGSCRPINNELARAFVLSALKSVDFVTIFDEDTPFELIKAILPDILIKGGDYNINTIVGADIVSENGGRVIVIPFISGYSTSAIIEKIKRDC
jgi:D-beta-D-heptose 7-phosphate kinase/D-beta-D-heptose 1-phosphate adenosyltransferase